MMMTVRRAGDPAQILRDPANFLHSIDVSGGRAVFHHTDPQLLRDATFLDGRSNIASNPAEPASLSDLIASTADQPTVKERLLFNVSFCGSTFLARLVDVPGQTLVLKEPQCLNDIAAWKVGTAREGRPLDELQPLLKMANSALGRSFEPGEAVAVKLACQGNVLVDALAENSAEIRPLFITSGRTNFLRAIFRGGVNRMRYIAKIAWNLATDLTDGDAMLLDAIGAGGDPLRKAANLAVLAQSFQMGAFERAAKAGDWNADHVVDSEEITHHPHEAAMKAAKALDLSLTAEDIELNVARLANRYSKLPSEPFSKDQQLAADRQLHLENRQVFDDALKWAEATLGPERKIGT